MCGQSPPTSFIHTTQSGAIIGYSPANLSATGSITFEAWIKLPNTVNQTWTGINCSRWEIPFGATFQFLMISAASFLNFMGARYNANYSIFRFQ
ncbi:MAG: hypothetical protein IPN80_11655 [Flavobacterium sp.]|nr:hypothetical protein [Flavobacterium sp.]